MLLTLPRVFSIFSLSLSLSLSLALHSPSPLRTTGKRRGPALGPELLKTDAAERCGGSDEAAHRSFEVFFFDASFVTVVRRFFVLEG